MVRRLGVQIGLLAFGVTLIAGLYAHNSATVILTRALIAMVLGVAVGQFTAAAARFVLREFLRRKKLALDHEHLAAVRTLIAGEPAEEFEEPEAVPHAGEVGEVR